jgi:hypothetical protein
VNYTTKKIIYTSKHSTNGFYALYVKQKADEAGNLPHLPLSK